ncbi:MAG: hypothetical protein QNK92_01515 [Amylibacter sp.]
MTNYTGDLDLSDTTVEDCQRKARKNLHGWDKGILHEELRTPARDFYTLLFEKHPDDAVRLMAGKLTEAKKAKREATQHIQDLASAGRCWELGNQSEPDIISIKLEKYHKIETLTYRFVYQVYNGIFLETEEFVRHQCNNRACIRPSHLLSGTAHQNRADEDSRVYSGRGAKGRGQGLELEGSIELSKLAPELKEWLQIGLGTDVRDPVGRNEQSEDGEELSHLLE